jgi:hypothetical protein
MEDLKPLAPSILSALDAIKPGRIRRVGSWSPNSRSAICRSAIGPITTIEDVTPVSRPI